MVEEIAVTYEVLFELVRMEKIREELQKLSPDIYENIEKYVLMKQGEADAEHTSVFSQTESEKAKKQLSNIKSLIKELFERRERKMFNIALMKIRTNTEPSDVKSILPKEIELYREAITALERHRFGFPSIWQGISLSKSFESKSIDGKISVPEKIKAETTNETLNLDIDNNKEKLVPENKTSGNEKKDYMKICFTKDIPSFLGRDLKTFGPFKTNEIIDLPAEYAKILVLKKCASEIKN